MTLTDKSFHWSLPTLPVLEGYGYSARIEAQSFGSKYPYRWYADYGHAVGGGYAKSIEGAKESAECWLKVEMERGTK